MSPQISKLSSYWVESAVVNLFNYRMNVIVPNVFWGLGLRHECDLLIVSPNRYATEVEIKISAADILADLRKAHNHESPIIRKLFFAVPDSLERCPNIPSDVGLIVVSSGGFAKIVRPPRLNKNARPLSQEQYLKLLHLGCMRIWHLKSIINNQRSKIRTVRGAQVCEKVEHEAF